MQGTIVKIAQADWNAGFGATRRGPGLILFQETEARKHTVR